MAINYTPAQRDAIASRDRALIVSAAAGSGKTAVLVDRVIGLICDQRNPIDIDQLLVVTYTNAAAAEMRGRIADALSARLAQNPGDRRLRRQLALLGESKIQTVHAFCQSLLRQNFVQAGVAPDFSLIDTFESDALKKQAMDAMLEAEYAADTPAFSTLRQNLCEERGDWRLEQAVGLIYDKLRSHPDPNAWLSYVAQAQPQSPELTHWGSMLMTRAHAQLRYATNRLCAARAELGTQPEVEAKYAPAFDATLEAAQGILTALSADWDAAVDALADPPKPRPGNAPKGADKAFTERMRAVREDFYKAAKSARKSGLNQSAAAVVAQMDAARPLVGELCRLVTRFSAEYEALKAGQNALDFSDLEHRTLALLRDADGEKTALAQALSQSFAEVLVDEYQDTNEIQERIFQSLCRQEGSAFFVGDIKQSIYRFRLANPQIFIDRLDTSAPLAQTGPGARAFLALGDNFRSLPPVLDLCNFIFERIMSRDFGDVDYDDTHRLRAGRTQPGGGCELWIVETAGLHSDDEDSEGKSELEAALAAQRVAHMLENEPVIEADGTSRPARPQDFAILLSSYTSKAPYYIQALREAGIPAQSDEDTDFFGSIEISIMLSLLRIIDNRRQDIPLVSVLRSPFFSFTADDLARIRLAAPGTDFCTALEVAAQDGDAKAQDFLARLDQLADLSRDVSVAQLLRHIYDEMGVRAVFAALDGGEGRIQSLEALYRQALAFESGSARGLYAFLARLDDQIAAEKQPSVPKTGGGVRLLSIHRSKGLEFPFVILPELSKRFNTDDSKGPVLFHQDYGIGITLREPALRAEYKTAAHMAIAAAIRREGYCEEMRKLYVAMTRARQRLVLIMSLQNVPKKLSQWAPEAGERIAPEFLAAQQGAAPWVCTALLSHPDGEPLRRLCDQPPLVEPGQTGGLTCTVVDWQDVPRGRWHPAAAEQGGEAPSDPAPALALLDKAYAHSAAAQLPSKLTPTGVKRLVPDAGIIDGRQGRVSVRMYATPEDEAARSNAARRGTALHIYLQHMDYAACADPEAARADILRVAMAGYLTPEEAQAIDLDAIVKLAASPLGRRVCGAARQMREYEFSVLFTADALLGNGMDGEEILLNGAIDLLLWHADGLEVVDFKSDSINPGFEARQAERHRLQLELYGRAAQAVFQLPVVRRTVFFLKTGREAAL